MTSLEDRRRLLIEARSRLKIMDQSRNSGDLMPTLTAMMNFMASMLEEDEATALIRLLKKNGMTRDY